MSSVSAIGAEASAGRRRRGRLGDRFRRRRSSRRGGRRRRVRRAGATSGDRRRPAGSARSRGGRRRRGRPQAPAAVADHDGTAGRRAADDDRRVGRRGVGRIRRPCGRRLGVDLLGRLHRGIVSSSPSAATTSGSPTATARDGGWPHATSAVGTPPPARRRRDAGWLDGLALPAVPSASRVAGARRGLRERASSCARTRSSSPGRRGRARAGRARSGGSCGPPWGRRPGRTRAPWSRLSAAAVSTGGAAGCRSWSDRRRTRERSSHCAGRPAAAAAGASPTPTPPTSDGEGSRAASTAPDPCPVLRVHEGWSLAPPSSPLVRRAGVGRAAADGRRSSGVRPSGHRAPFAGDLGGPRMAPSPDHELPQRRRRSGAAATSSSASSPAARAGSNPARRSTSSTSRLPIPAMRCWSSSTALTGALLPRQHRCELPAGDGGRVRAEHGLVRTELDAAARRASSSASEPPATEVRPSTARPGQSGPARLEVGDRPGAVDDETAGHPEPEAQDWPHRCPAAGAFLGCARP